jgi:N,N'-diacetyllegionaminate synthase
MNGQKLNNKKNTKEIKFIAEIASSHNGSKKNFLNLIKSLIKVDVDIIKIQIFKPDELAHSSYKFYKVLKRINLSYKNIDEALKFIFKNKKEVVLEPFDYSSYLYCKKYKNKAFLKISSSETDNAAIFNDALLNFKKIFFSVPGKNIKDIKKIFKNNHRYKNKIIPTYGFQSFPTNLKDLRLPMLKNLSKLNGNACYADHTSSDSIALNLLVISKSIKLGANYIEKHVTLDRFKNYPDSESSLDVHQFNEMIKFFKTQIPIKSTLSLMEKKYSVGMKKYAVLKNDIEKNSKVASKDIKFLRTGTRGIDINQFNKIEYLLTKKKLKKNEILQTEFFC